MSSKNLQPQVFEDVTVRGRLQALGPVVLGDGGNVFHVAPSTGNDTHDGQTKVSAVATMTEALSRCTANAGDVIVRHKGTESVTAPVAFNVAGVTVVAADYGAPSRAKGENFMTYNSSATGLSAGLVTQPTRFIGVGFAASDVSEEALQVFGTGGFSGGFVSIERCRFPLWNGSLACSVRCRGGALINIDDCEFDGLFPLNATGYGTAAIIMDDDGVASVPFYNSVTRNRFRGIGTGKHAIHHAAAAVEALYAFNELGASGAFLDENSLASTGIVHTNYLGGANKAAMFSNIGSTNLKIVNNKYNEA